MLDVYLRGDVERISPEAPVPVVRVRDRRYALGGAGNVAQNVCAVGATCDLVATIGRRRRRPPALRACSARSSANVGSLVTVDRPTTTKTRIVARSQQVVRVDEEEDDDLEWRRRRPFAGCRARAVDRRRRARAGGLQQGRARAARHRSARCTPRARKGIPIVVDPKYRNFFLYRGATIFKPNRRELEAALGAEVDLEHPDALPATFERLGVGASAAHPRRARHGARVVGWSDQAGADRRRARCTTSSARVTP